MAATGPLRFSSKFNFQPTRQPPESLPKATKTPVAPAVAPAPQPRKRGRPPKNKTTAAPEPKRQRATPKEGPPAAVVGVGIASQAQATVGEGGQTTRSGRQVRLTKKAAEAQGAV
jgi:pyruvate/2-oxoglutarate dehydrogenase complex dihydrolipoamide acyltransferase (E2) component